jgi:hypothetical protein
MLLKEDFKKNRFFGLGKWNCLFVFAFALLVVFTSSVRAQDEDVFEADFAKASGSRWFINGQVGFQLQPNPYVKGSWTASALGLPMAALGAKFKLMDRWLGGLSLFARSDFVYTQEAFDIQTAFGSASIDRKRLILRVLGEADYFFYKGFAGLLALGIGSPALYHTYTMSVRGYDTALLENANEVDGVVQLGVSYLFASQTALSAIMDYRNAVTANHAGVVSILVGMSYGL